MSAHDTVLFDIGKVLLDWDPRYYYARFFAGDPAGLERFATEVVGPEFYLAIDAGRASADVIAERQRRFPQHADLIARWMEGWQDMLRGPIAGTVDILRELKARGTRLYALTNFSTETWPQAAAQFDFLGWFSDVVVSGEVGLVKPDPRIYELTIRRCRLDPGRTVFTDDTQINIDAARACGLDAVLFTAPAALRADLVARGLL
jgi:2-haloacid dehalogenase